MLLCNASFNFSFTRTPTAIEIFHRGCCTGFTYGLIDNFTRTLSYQWCITPTTTVNEVITSSFLCMLTVVNSLSFILSEVLEAQHLNISSVLVAASHTTGFFFSRTFQFISLIMLAFESETMRSFHATQNKSILYKFTQNAFFCVAKLAWVEQTTFFLENILKVYTILLEQQVGFVKFC